MNFAATLFKIVRNPLAPSLGGLLQEVFLA
jgi:hypothetical protein